MTALLSLLAQSGEYVYRSRWERRWDALKSGDPVTWGVLIVALLIFVGWPLLQKMRARGGDGRNAGTTGDNQKH